MNNKPPQRNLWRKYPLLSFAIATIVPYAAFTTPPGSGRDSVIARGRPIQGETPHDKYITVSPEAVQTSPAYRMSTNSFFAAQVNVDDSSRNIRNDAANEPSIAVDPNNANRIVIGWRQFNAVTNNFRQAGWAYTTNGGRKWRFPGVIEPGVFRSDPVLDSDLEGNFYYNSLTSVGSTFRCDVFKSTDGGATWGPRVYARGGDKQWMTIDKTGGQGSGNIYSSWTSDYSECLPGFFTRSTNRGSGFESCVAIPREPFWGSLAVGPGGELYVCGADSNRFVVAKSTSARNPLQIVSWDTASAVNLGGEIQAFIASGPNPVGLLGQAWVAVDRSSGPGRGNVYVLCSVKRYSSADPLDVMFTRSTDGGRSWSAPVRVNDDAVTTAWQWFGTMSVAPDGRIDVVWLDTRDNPGSVNSALYYASSTDAGATWSRNTRLSESFNPYLGWPQQNKMGDYFHMISDEGGAHLAWAATFNGEEDVYYGRITYPLTGIAEYDGRPRPTSFALSQNYPNPFNPATTLEVALPYSGFATVRVFNVIGKKVATLVEENMTAGIHTVRWDASGVPSGVYFCRLEAAGFVQTNRMILLR